MYIKHPDWENRNFSKKSIFSFPRRLLRGGFDSCIIPEETRKRSTKWGGERSTQTVRELRSLMMSSFCFQLDVTGFVFFFYWEEKYVSHREPLNPLDGFWINVFSASRSWIEFLFSRVAVYHQRRSHEMMSANPLNQCPPHTSHTPIKSEGLPY